MKAISREEFNAWVVREQPKFRRMAGSILRNRAEAEDTVQETLASVWQHAQAGDIANLNAYASRAVWQNSLKLRSRRSHFVSLDAEQLEAKGIQVTTEPLPEPDLMPWELEEALKGLPVAQQTVIRLRFYRDYSFREIGQALGISIHTAASSCRYALERMKDALKKI